jgi:hypothetical protein
VKRNIFLVVIIIALIGILWVIYSHIIVFPLPDFLEYWASGRLNLTAGNPYDPNQMMTIEQTVGWNLDHALMMLNPPWVLPYAMLVGIFSYPISRFLGFLIQLAMVCASSILLWRIYNGKKINEWIAWVVVLTFGPILQAFKSGQITILVLLGTVCFLYFIVKKSDFWAGVFASLVLFKPQLLYLFILAIIFWSISRRRYNVLIGMVFALIIYLGVSWLVNPQIFLQYIYMTRYYPLQNWMTSTLGTYLRYLINPEIFYIQFIPTFAGLSWFLFFWMKHRKSFDWITDLPKIILISIATTPYGWTHDAAVCVICVIQITTLFNFHQWTFKKTLIFTTYWVINLLIMFFRISQIWFWWYPSFLLLWYLLSYHHLSSNKPVINNPELIEVANYG